MNITSALNPHTAPAARTLVLPNDADPLAHDLTGVQRIDLHFPSFTDGRAYSQAFLLRRRQHFVGEIRATGDVLLDQLLHLHRCGFNAAVLRADQDMARAQAMLRAFTGFYQHGARQAEALA